MRGRRRRLGALAVLAGLSLPALALGESPAGREAGRVSKYDIMTRGDLLLSHLVAPSVRGEVGDWPLLAELPGQVGDWVRQYVDAAKIAHLIAATFPIEGQAATRPVEELVDGCARSLDVGKPLVYIRNAAEARAYAVEAGGRTHLVLTSGLLELFAGCPEQLKFVVGRELGHLKCGHGELTFKAFALEAALQGVNIALVPERYQNALPDLGMGRLLSWDRESEISADRAGLLCCDGPDSAYQAIMRLQHGLKAGSPWVDPVSPDFDPKPILESFREWQDEPFLKAILYIQGRSLRQLYCAERLASLKVWAGSDAYRALAGRAGALPSDVLVEVASIRAFELAAPGKSVSPYVVVSDGLRPLLRTASGSGLREAEWSDFSPKDKLVQQPRQFRDGQPLYFEIWDDGYLGDTLLGGFAVYPRVGEAAAVPGKDGVREVRYTATIDWDWQTRQAVSRAGYAEVLIRFTNRHVAAGGGASGGGK